MTFNHRDDPTLDYAAEFVEAWGKKIGQPWEVGPADKKRIKAGSRELFHNFGRYQEGFITWAIEEHCRRFPECRYIPSPMSLRYLWERYATQPKAEGREFLEELLGE